MWSYLKSAFFVRVYVPPFGNVPVNIVGLLGFVMLGFGMPAFWLLGLGLETAFLYALSTNQRFQRYVNTKKALLSEQEFVEQWRKLVNQLDFTRKQKLQVIERKCEQVMEKYRESETAEYVIDTNQSALRQLAWLYLKLLIAQNNLETLDRNANETDLKRQISVLEKELAEEELRASVRESKEATLKILQRRMENLDRRETSLEEIESDLNRIEAQIDLAVENATMQGQPEAISANIELFSHALEDRFFGESADTIANLDQTLRQQN